MHLMMIMEVILMMMEGMLHLMMIIGGVTAPDDNE